jgi:type III secretion system low calcium response chaperone LcrH/SycD
MTTSETSLPSAEQAVELLQYLLSGNTLNAALGQSAESEEALYGVGYTFYNQAKYKEAMRIFAYLLTTNHLDRRYYQGFAACLQMQRRHADALKYFGIASMLDLTDPEPVMHSAECYLALGDRAQARLSLEYALTQARGHVTHGRFVDRLEAMLSFLDNLPAEEGNAGPHAQAGPGASDRKDKVNTVSVKPGAGTHDAKEKVND